MYTLSTDKLLFEITSFQIYERELHLALNTNMNVSVKNGAFTGSADLNLDVKQLAEFAKKIKNMADTLKGNAEIKELYGNRSYIRFKGKGTGIFTINGKIYGDRSSRSIEFEESFDHEHLQKFANDMYKQFARYEKKRNINPLGGVLCDTEKERAKNY